MWFVVCETLDGKSYGYLFGRKPQRCAGNLGIWNGVPTEEEPFAREYELKREEWPVLDMTWEDEPVEVKLEVVKG